MSYIKNYIENLNKNSRKALSIFLTAGFPSKNNFIEIARTVLTSGADILELGIPFSDPLADGPIIQTSSTIALKNNTTIKDVFYYTEKLSNSTNKPIILMGYANPIIRYNKNNFMKDAENAGAKGLIIPDVPLEEYDYFFNGCDTNLDIILLTTPTSSNERIKLIDEKSRGFVYCVSVTGTTGIKDYFTKETYENLKRTYSLIKKNKMMIGFGISKADDIINFSQYCDGVIVGSKIIKSILDGYNYEEIGNLISELSTACEMHGN
ncbi:MAG: tryptophan synthase subunit alpha [Melioribacter sp.]|nr:tryptophan synthase subunit alpha [Melioribacter sp.]